MNNPIKFRWLWKIISIFCVFVIVVEVVLLGIIGLSFWKAGTASSWWMTDENGHKEIHIYTSKSAGESAAVEPENRQEQDGALGSTNFQFGSTDLPRFRVSSGEPPPAAGAREVQPFIWLLVATWCACLIFAVSSIVVALYVGRTVRYFNKGVYFTDDVLRPLKTAARASIFLCVWAFVMDHLPAILVNIQFPSKDGIGTEVEVPGYTLAICLALNVLLYILTTAKNDTEELRQIV